MQGPSVNDIGCPGPVTLTCKVTNDARNHERPTIADNGTIAWFQDGTGGGLGYAMVRRAPVTGATTIVQFSSRNFSCNPLTGICNPPQERAAGKTFGMDGDGRTISFFTFYSFGSPQYRRFDLTGTGHLPTDSSPADLAGFEAPDINRQGTITLRNVHELAIRHSHPDAAPAMAVDGLRISGSTR